MSLVSLFLILLLALSAVVLLLTEPSRSEKLLRERLGSLAPRPAEGPVANTNEALLAQVSFSSIRWVDMRLRKSKIAANLQTLFEQAKVKWTVGRFLFASLAAAELGIVAGSYQWPGTVLGWIPGLALGAVPYMYIRRQRNKRCKKFNQLLPDAIDLMSRA